MGTPALQAAPRIPGLFLSVDLVRLKQYADGISPKYAKQVWCAVVQECCVSDTNSWDNMGVTEHIYVKYKHQVTADGFLLYGRYFTSSLGPTCSCLNGIFYALHRSCLTPSECIWESLSVPQNWSDREALAINVCS